MPETSPGHVLHWADNQAIVYSLASFRWYNIFRMKAKRLETNERDPFLVQSVPLVPVCPFNKDTFLTF